MSERFVIPASDGWFNTVKVGDEAVSTPVLGWLVTVEAHYPRALPIVWGPDVGVVWNEQAGTGIDVPSHVLEALGVAEVENITITRPSR